MARKRGVKRQAHRVQFSDATFALGQKLVTSGKYANLDAMCFAFFRVADGIRRMQTEMTKALRDAARKPSAAEQRKAARLFASVVPKTKARR